MKKLVYLLVMALAVPSARAAEVILKNRQSLVGETEMHLDYIVLTTRAGKIRIERSQIEKIISTETLKKKYAEKLKALGPKPKTDKLEELASWCERKGLWEEHRSILKKLGKKEKKQPEVVSPASRPAPETTVGSPSAKTQNLGRRHWMRTIQRLSVKYRRSRDKIERRDIHARLMAINDPQAYGGFIRQMSNTSPDVRELFIRIVATKKIPGAGKRMAEIAMTDRDPEIRKLALSSVAPLADDATIRYLTAKLSNKPEDVETTSQAARVLAETGNPKAVDKLIKVMVVNVPVLAQGGVRLNDTQRQYLKTFRPVVGDRAAAYQPVTGTTRTGVSIGRSSFIPYTIQPVYDALVQITGEDFGPHPNLWRDWWRKNGREFTREYLRKKEKEKEKKK